MGLLGRINARKPVITITKETPIGTFTKVLPIVDPEYRQPGESVLAWRNRTRSFTPRGEQGGGELPL